MINKKYLESVSLHSVVFTMARSEYQQREIILLNHTQKPNLSYRALAKLLKYPQSTVCSVLKKFRERLTLDWGSCSRGKQGVKDKKKKPVSCCFLHRIPSYNHAMSQKRYKCRSPMCKKSNQEMI